MIGSRIVELLSGKYDFEDLSLEKGVDITDKKMVIDKINLFEGQWIIHLAAKADVDGCEMDKSEDIKISGYKDIKRFSGLKTAWAINVEGTRNVASAAQKFGKKIIYISTDFVFDGQNPPSGGYSEEDRPRPLNWYAQTKYEGEKIVLGMESQWIICRPSFPYRANFSPKKDFVRAILDRLKTGEKIVAVSDQMVTPTFIDDIAFALDKLINDDSRGIFHLTGSQSLTPYEAARLIAKVFGQDANLIQKIGGEDYFTGRAERPFKLILKNDKIKKLGVKMRTFEEGLEETKRQLHL